MIFGLCISWFAAPPAFAVEGPPANLELFQTLSATIGTRIAAQLPKSDSLTVSLLLHPESVSWIVQGPLARSMDKAGGRIVSAGGMVQAECVVSTLNVMYEDVRRDGFLGTQILDRLVTVRISASLIDTKSGLSLLNDVFEESRRDTVDLSSVSRLEEPGIPATHGTIPDGGFFSWFLEPVIMLGGIAVSVYLLFHIRS